MISVETSIVGQTTILIDGHCPLCSCELDATLEAKSKGKYDTAARCAPCDILYEIGHGDPVGVVRLSRELTVEEGSRFHAND